MKITVFGGTGIIGSAISRELRERGHDVLPVARADGDVTDENAVRELISTADAIVSAVGARRGSSDDPATVELAAKILLNVLKERRSGHLVVVGGAGSLRTPSGTALIDTPDFPDAWKPSASAQVRALELYRNEPEVAWTYVSPAASILPGERTGSYRTGGDDLLVDASGNSEISVEDYAVAVADVVERGGPGHERISVAY